MKSIKRHGKLVESANGSKLVKLVQQHNTSEINDTKQTSGISKTRKLVTLAKPRRTCEISKTK